MTIADDFDLSQAQANYAVANTPLFLLRKLQEDETIKAISQKLSGLQILRELEQAVGHRPENLLQAVLPYVCLAALWMKPDASFLQSTTRITPSYNDDWFRYARHALIQTYRPTSQHVISLPMIVTPKAQISNTSSTAQHTLIMPKSSGH